MPKVIGITGTIGSGKSTVGGILAALAVPVIDTDHIVHDLLTHPGPVREAVAERFGDEVVAHDRGGAINRGRLGSIVFFDAAARRDLERIVHPAVLAEYRRRITELGSSPVVAVLVPLLFEAGLQAEFDEVWTVVADEHVIRRRLCERDRLSEEEIQRRLSAQLPQERKAGLSDRVIDNSGTIEQTRDKVAAYLGALIS